MLTTLEQHLALPAGAIKVYVLVEQLEASFQLMEIRAALGAHFVGFNTGRWDYINSVADAMAWDPAFVNPNIDAIAMTYGYMRNYEDRVRRAVNTPDRDGRFALWQGGMEPNIPVGSEAGRRGRDEARGGRRRARAARRRQRQVGGPLEDGAHRAAGVGEGRRRTTSSADRFPRSRYDRAGRRRPGPARAGAAHGARRARSAQRRAPVRQRLRPGVPGRGAQAGRLLRQRRRALPDGGHGDRRDPAEHPLGVAAQGGRAHRGRRGHGRAAGRRVHAELFERLLDEEYAKLLAAGNRDVHDDSKTTTLPIAREIVPTYVTAGCQGALVHRSAQHQPRTTTTSPGAAAHRPVHGARSAGTAPASPRTWTSTRQTARE